MIHREATETDSAHIVNNNYKLMHSSMGTPETYESSLQDTS